MLRIAMISAHGCPLALPGGRETGGMNIYVRELSRALGRRNIAVDVFTRRKDSQTPDIVEFGENARVIHLKAGATAEMDKNDVYHHLPEFVHNLRRFQQLDGLSYDVIHSHYWLSGWVGSLLQQRWHVPHVVMFHTLGEVKNRARVGEQESQLRIDTERKIFNAADRVIVAGVQEKNQMVRLYGASPQRIDVVPCGVDLSLFRPVPKAAARRTLGLGKGKVLLFVGRMDPVKGIDILLNAVARLEERDTVQLLIVGGNDNDPERARAASLAQQLGIAKQVRFCGAIEQERLPVYYSAADVSVVPSYYESFGLVAVEALACGTPVVATRVGGLTLTIRDSETGYLVPWRCPEPFADRLDLLIGNDSLRERFARAARPSVIRFDWSNIAGHIEQVYDCVRNPLHHLCAQG